MTDGTNTLYFIGSAAVIYNLNGTFSSGCIDPWVQPTVPTYSNSLYSDTNSGCLDPYALEAIGVSSYAQAEEILERTIRYYTEKNGVEYSGMIGEYNGRYYIVSIQTSNKLDSITVNFGLMPRWMNGVAQAHSHPGPFPYYKPGFSENDSKAALLHPEYKMYVYVIGDKSILKQELIVDENLRITTYIDGSVEQTNVKYALDKYRSELG